MVSDGLRGVLQSFAALIRSLFAVPRQPEPVVPAAADAQPVPADRTSVLFAQFAAGVRGSRAPPAASA